MKVDCSENPVNERKKLLFNVLINFSPAMCEALPSDLGDLTATRFQIYWRRLENLGTVVRYNSRVWSEQ